MAMKTSNIQIFLVFKVIESKKRSRNNSFRKTGVSRPMNSKINCSMLSFTVASVPLSHSCKIEPSSVQYLVNWLNHPYSRGFVVFFFVICDKKKKTLTNQKDNGRLSSSHPVSHLHSKLRLRAWTILEPLWKGQGSTLLRRRWGPWPWKLRLLSIYMIPSVN